MPAPARPYLGTPGHLAVFLSVLAAVLLAPPAWVLPVGAAGLAGLAALYPGVLRRTLRPQWLVVAGLPVVLHLLFPPTPPDLAVGPLLLSSAGVLTGLGMAMRALVALAAVDGLSLSVEIAELAGVLERLGLRGLGFSVGVAVNLLPSLRSSWFNAWHSLRLRGGLRARRARALRLVLVTVLANALRRAEEIALAAEARAFTPERSRALPVRRGRLDALAVGCGLLLVVVLIVTRG